MHSSRTKIIANLNISSAINYCLNNFRVICLYGIEQRSFTVCIFSTDISSLHYKAVDCILILPFCCIVKHSISSTILRSDCSGSNKPVLDCSAILKGQAKRRIVICICRVNISVFSKQQFPYLLSVFEDSKEEC